MEMLGLPRPPEQLLHPHLQGCGLLWIIIQGDQLNMAVFFLEPCFKWLVQCTALFSLRVYTGQVTFSKVPDKHGHVELVTLYIPCSPLYNYV